jgi:XTP/dITP diphosphohydrolase/tetrapyrrole methylase family protein/MazG family protein/ATP diphosphatase
VADHCREKLIRRHPHVFGEVEAETAGEVLRNWNQIKREDERGGEVFGAIPETLPSTLYAKKVLKRAESAGLESPSPDAQDDFEEHGERLLATVSEAVAAGVDPELALRAAADRFREAVEGGRSPVSGAGQGRQDEAHSDQNAGPEAPRG